MRLTPLRAVSEVDVAESQGQIRALVHERLEQMWEFCEPHILGSLDRTDPRMVELGLRVLKDLAALYRLDRELVVPETDVDVSPREAARRAVGAQVRELVARSE